MTFRIRPACGDDFGALYEMAKLTGGGFTNLPADRGALVGKLARSDTSFARPGDEQSGDLYVFVLEDPERRLIRGTCQVFGQVGVVQPFYSYHQSTLTQSSPELGKNFRNQMLSLTTDLEGCSEVGGQVGKAAAGQLRHLVDRAEIVAARGPDAVGHARASIRRWPSVGGWSARTAPRAP